MNMKTLFATLNDDIGEMVKKIIIISVIVALFIPVFIVIIISCVLSMPKEWLKNFILSFEGDRHIEIFYQIRPDLIDDAPEEGDGNDERYHFVLPIKRTVQHYYGEKGSYTGGVTDYIVYNCDGDNIYSIGDGDVIDADNTSIIVRYEAAPDDENNWYVFAKYWPLSEVHVENGDKVEKGEVIAQADILGDDKVDEYTTLKIFCFGMWGDSDESTWVDPITLIGEKSFEEQYKDVIVE